MIPERYRVDLSREELLLNTNRENIKYCESRICKTSLDEIVLSLPVRKSIELLCSLTSEKLVNLSDKCRELWNELYDTLRDNSNTEVISVVRSLLYRISDVVCDISK